MSPAPAGPTYGPDAFFRQLAEFAPGQDVSRETRDRLTAYADLLVRWQKRINLIAGSTVDDLWFRHMLDSAQLLRHLPAAAGDGPAIGKCVDLGAGAGFPGLVLAICGAEADTVLVESDQRKAAFLIEAIRLTGAPARVLAIRAENWSDQKPPETRADLVVARALAPLDRLLDLAAPISGPTAICLFHKGARWQDELTAARERWKIHTEPLPSLTDPEARILRISKFSEFPGLSARSGRP